MASPAHHGFFRRVIARVIIAWDVDGLPLRDIPVVFFFQSIPVVFAVACDKDLPPFPGGYNVYARVVGHGHHGELWYLFDILAPYLGMTGVGHVKNIIKAAEKRNVFFFKMVFENAEELVVQVVLGHAVVVV